MNQQPLPLRVCMIVHQNYYTDARVRRYAESLAKDGARVDIICVTAAGQDVQQTAGNITVHPIPIGRGYKSQINYLLEYFAAFFLYFFKLTSLHFKNHFDIIHVHNMPDFLVFTALIPRLMGTPVILDIHDPMPEFYMSKFSNGDKHPVVAAIRFQEMLSAKFASALITVCQGARDCLLKRGAKTENISIIYNTPSPEIFDKNSVSENRGKKREYFTLIFPGTQAPRYGLDIPIRALPNLIPAIANIKLQFIGRQVAYSHELDALAQQLGVAEHVEFIPAIPIDEIPGRMAAADIGIYPAVKEPYMDMAVPVKVFEYATMGLPIVAARLTVLEEIFSDKAIAFFESGNVEQFAARILELYQNPDRIKAMTIQAEQEYQKGFSWESGRKEYYLLLNRLMKGRKVLPVP
jgi:glycosyltransferase involved in cell wall biosynthesis